MPIVVAVLLSGFVGWLTTARLAPGLTARAPMRIPNYRGLSVSTGIGIAGVIGTVTAVAVLWLVPIATNLSPAARAALTWPFVIGLVGFGLLGAWDDLSGEDPAGGEPFRSGSRRVDPARGGLRVVAGLAIAIVATPPAATIPRVVSVALIYLAATLVRGAEPRPGRAGKLVVVLSATLLIMSFFIRPELAPAIAALGASAAALLPLDLRERATPGRLGASSLGAALGVATVILVGLRLELIIVTFLAGLHAVSRRPLITTAFTSRGPLARLDALGRVPENRPVPVERG